MTAAEIVARARQWVRDPRLDLLDGMTVTDIAAFLAVVTELRPPTRVRIGEPERLRLRRMFEADQRGVQQ